MPVHSLYFWCVGIRGHSDPGETGPPKANQSLELVKAGLSVRLSYVNRVVQTPHSNYLLPTHPNHPRARYGQLEMTPMPQSPLKSPKQASPKPAASASFLPLHEPRQRLRPNPPPRSLCLRPPWCFPTWPWVASCAPPLVTVSNNLSFQWQWPPNLLASPCLNNNKIYIQKH